MSYTSMEDAHLTYYKLMDGLESLLNIGSGKVLDLSFNDFVTARHMVDNRGVHEVRSVSDMKVICYPGIEAVRIDRNLSYTIRRMRADTIVSLGGSFRFQPIHDVMYSIHGCLSVGGRVLIAVYPGLYNMKGKDMLAAYSAGSGIPVAEKLSRWHKTVFNTISNLFVNVKQEEVIMDTDPGEVMALFSSDCFYRYLFRDSADYDKFFSLIGEENRYVLSWKVINALKV
ncbi:hypothetical protein [Limisalsivibrio acetivorans]|uniref:hypothetical protein n=1 Tax=Limisalsivibrio acetivorans TaxID=1304888 RepID=UPI0003F516CB|nr:hypothetical protein [Limisalsivibrio acetivorans]